MSQKVEIKKTEASEPEEPVPTSTNYGELASTLIASLNQFTAAIPDFGNPQGVTKAFVARKRQVPQQFVVNAVSAILVDGDLQSIRQLKSEEVLDDKRYVEAFTPVLRHLQTAFEGLKFAVSAVGPPRDELPADLQRRPLPGGQPRSGLPRRPRREHEKVPPRVSPPAGDRGGDGSEKVIQP